MLNHIKGPILGLILLVILPMTPYAWDTDELELFDLVEEIQQNFYEVLGLDASASAADIRRAYRRLSLQLHPDKNKEENAEEKFRQLVAVAEVLRDEDRRQRYDEILEHGLPDWRQPVFYYRRVRKMGLLELSVLLTLILTVGHYLVIWSIYWERRFELESIFPKKRKEKKSKKSSKQAVDGNSHSQQDPLSILDDPNILCKPQISDALPCQIFKLLKSLIFSIPTVVVWVGVQIENWKESRRKLKEEELEEDEEEEDKCDDTDRDRTKRRQRLDPALYEYDRTSVAPAAGVHIGSVCDTNSAINNGQPKIKQSHDEWTQEDTGKLIRAMAKYPGGTAARWDKIANEVGWPVEQVTKKAKAIKSSGYATHVNTAAQGITGGVQHSVVSKSGKILADDITKLSNNQTSSVPNVQSANAHSTFDNYDEEPEENMQKRKTSKPVKTAARTLMITQSQNNVSQVNTDDDRGVEKQDDGASNLIHPGVESCAWTQRQQKVLEKALSIYPKGTEGRWDKIADAVPGKSKEECLTRYKELVEVIRRKKQMAGDQ